MRERVDRTIDGVDYGLMPISVFKASKVFTKLVKMFGVSLLKLIAGVEQSKPKSKTKKTKSVLDADISMSELQDGVQEILMSIEEDDFQELCEAFFPDHHLFAGKEQVKLIDNHLSQYGLMHGFKLLKFAIEVNFSDFLAVAKDTGKLFQKK